MHSGYQAAAPALESGKRACEPSPIPQALSAVGLFLLAWKSVLRTRRLPYCHTETEVCIEACSIWPSCVWQWLRHTQRHVGTVCWLCLTLTLPCITVACTWAEACVQYNSIILSHAHPPVYHATLHTHICISLTAPAYPCPAIAWVRTRNMLSHICIHLPPHMPLVSPLSHPRLPVGVPKA